MFKCDLDDSKFDKRNFIKIHIVSVHDGKKAFKCVNCKSKFHNMI